MKNRMKNMTSFSMPIYKNLINLPTPTSINYMWNMGSMLGFIMIIQILTGLFLSMHYSPSMAFDAVINMSRNVFMGLETRFIHSNGASMFFVLIYIHIARGLMNFSFKKTETWLSGLVMLFLLMGTAFLGYVLPWGQMSFWGATVITNLVSVVPILGIKLVQWLWGNFSVDTQTLNRFFSLHFLFPFVLVGISMIHLMSLHHTGSSNPIGLNSNQEKINFYPLFMWKDLLTPFIIFFLMGLFSWKWPYMLMDPENFSLANPMNTPIHIQPEWYFLFAYALLRSIPNKIGGVMLLLMSILSLSFLTMKKIKNKISKFNMWYKSKNYIFFTSFMILTWLGAMPMDPPYILTSKIIGMIYFSFMLI